MTADAAVTARAARLLRRAEQWLRHGDRAAAANALAQARRLAPADPAIAALESALQAPAHPGRRAGAEPVAERESPDAQVRRARALRDAGRYAEAAQTLRAACERYPDHADAWFNLGTLMFVGAKTAEAAEAFDRAWRLAPRHVPTLLGFAESLQGLGRTGEAAARLREAIAIEPLTVHAWHSLVNLKTVRLDDAETAQLEAIHASGALDDGARAVAGFALAAALERQQRYAQAWTAVSEANALKRRTLHWDADGFSRLVDELTDIYATPIAGADDPSLGREAIFIVSMPRSGSTLVEQILAAHSDVAGGGELREVGVVLKEESARRGTQYPHWVHDVTPADWTRMGRRYLERTRRWQTRPRFTDKGLSNWNLLGALAAMLPGAAILHVVRDPLETCWSCYKQLFPVGQPFTYDLDELARLRHDYERLMRFWQARHPGRIHDVVYEDLVAAPDAAIRGLLAATDLPFEPACLQFHRAERSVRTPSAAQVREPLRTDTARAPRYGAVLDPLRAALARAGARTP